LIEGKREIPIKPARDRI